MKRYTLRGLIHDARPMGDCKMPKAIVPVPCPSYYAHPDARVQNPSKKGSFSRVKLY